MNCDFFEEYEEFEDSFLFLDRKSEREARLKYADRLEKRLEECLGSRDIYHQLGHCLYHIDDWKETEEIKDRIERSFQRSLSLDAGSYFSLMFLGFFYFDVSEYKLSICCAETLFQHPKKECIPKWRLLRLQSIMITCHVLLEAFDIAELRNILERLLESYAKSKDEDVEEAQPTELVSALKKCAFSEELEIARLIEKLEALGQM